MRKDQDTNMYSTVFLDKLGNEIHEGDIVVCPQKESFEHYDTGELVCGKVVGIPKSYRGKRIYIRQKNGKTVSCDNDNLLIINKLLEK